MLHIGQILLRITGGAAVAFIVWAGIQMAMSRGDESKITTARNAVFNVLWGVGIALGAQMIVSYAVTEPAIAGIQDEVSAFAAAISVMLTVFNSIFALTIIYAASQMVIGQGKEDVMTTQKRTITWAIVGAVIVNIANAAVHIVTSFLGG